MSDKKPHHFEVVMNSYSLVDGKQMLNQEVIVREYADTPSQLTAKQMELTRVVIPAIVGAFDGMSKILQDQGMVEMAEAFEAETGKGKGQGASQKPQER
jgi:hypothetical protein